MLKNEWFPETSAVLQAVERAVTVEWGIVAQAQAQLPVRQGASRKLKRMRHKEWHHKRRLSLAEEQLRDLKRCRIQGVLSLEWIARAALAPPRLPARTSRAPL